MFNNLRLEVVLYIVCIIIGGNIDHHCLSFHTLITVVKELRSKMFGQHPGYFKAVFLKQTRIIIASIYKYTVNIMF
jgi:hypothetical protein